MLAEPQPPREGRPMELSSLIDSVLPGKNSLLDRASEVSRDAVERATEHPAVRPLTHPLRGNEWLGPPLHPVVVAVPIGAWTATAWFDARSAASDDPADERAADGALMIGVLGAVASAVTGLVQYV